MENDIDAVNALKRQIRTESRLQGTYLPPAAVGYIALRIHDEKVDVGDIGIMCAVVGYLAAKRARTGP